MDEKMRNRPVPKPKKKNEVKFAGDDALDFHVIDQGQLDEEELGEELGEEDIGEELGEEPDESIPDNVMDEPLKKTLLITDKRNEERGVNRDELLERIKAKRKGQVVVAAVPSAVAAAHVPSAVMPSVAGVVAAAHVPEINFNSKLGGKYAELSNFYGDVEICYMQKRFRNPKMIELFNIFKTCDAEEFIRYLKLLQPEKKFTPGQQKYWFRGAEPIRGILAKLVGAVIVQPEKFRRRINGIAQELGITPAEVVENAGETNDDDMRECLRMKYSIPKYRTLLLETHPSILHEQSPARSPEGNRWTKPGGDILGVMLMEERDNLLKDKQSPPESELPAYKIIIEADDAVPKQDRIIKVKGADKVPAKKVKETSIVQMNENVSNIFENMPDDINVKTPVHYLDNQEIFVKEMNASLNKIFGSSGQDVAPPTCDSIFSTESSFELLIHQKIIQYYLNIFSPYRGLLLYHGLGAGKTCGSIAIAEGLKNFKKILIMTPASLRMNYVEELKKCGDPLYKRKQFWTFMDVASAKSNLKLVAEKLGLQEEYIIEKRGAWVVDHEKDENYSTLSPADKLSLDKQINKMITNKYEFINYNGIRNKQYDELTKNGKINPFDNKVIIIDEAHNFISRIVNKLKSAKTKREASLAYKMYLALMKANNAKIVLLSGTPMINYPNEIGILFNILRGQISTWEIPINIETSKKVDQEYFENTLGKSTYVDYINYSANSKVLEVTRTPFGFINRYEGDEYKGVVLHDTGGITDTVFIDDVKLILGKDKITFDKRRVKNIKYKALPDDIEEFMKKFINFETKQLSNETLLMKRIVGLTSYYRSAQEGLMPNYNPETDLIIEATELSDYQFGIYNQARSVERSQEKNIAKKKKKAGDLYEEVSSTYRIFSRLFCNFVFPDGIKRPMPNEKLDVADNIKKGFDENVIDVVTEDELVSGIDGIMADEVGAVTEEINKLVDKTYEQRIKESLISLKEMGGDALSFDALEIYSPKFKKLVENLLTDGHVGKHLVYSQFRTLEGIGIIKLILEFNGFIEFKLKRDADGEWVMDIPSGLEDRPMFALYTGTETAEEKELTRNIFNDDLDMLPTKLQEQIKSSKPQNTMGDFIKIFMITASGAEGISLKNVRYVHIVEPYWHPVRREQVIGRAKRICSHTSLPPELRNIKVFMYIMTVSKKQLDEGDKNAIEMKLKDRSDDGKRVITTDEFLHEKSDLKQTISNYLLTAIKKSSIDCKFHNGQNLVCYSVNNPDGYNFIPDYNKEENDEIRQKNKKTVKMVPIVAEFLGKKVGKKPGIKQKFIIDEATSLFYNHREFVEYMGAMRAKKEGNMPDPIGEIKRYVDSKGAKREDIIHY